MPDADKQALLTHLEDSRRALLEALAQIGPDLATWKPEPGKWSVLDCMEHLTVAEELMLGRLKAAQPASSPVGSRDREQGIWDRATDRTNPRSAPEPSRPSGRYASLPDAISAFSAARARSIEWIASQTTDLRSLETAHPLIPGPVNCYEVGLILAAHPLRHVEQIRAIRSQWGGL